MCSASASVKSSPTYSHTNVPAGMGLGDRRPQPFLSVLNTSSGSRIPFCTTRFAHFLGLQPHRHPHSKIAWRVKRNKPLDVYTAPLRGETTKTSQHARTVVTPQNPATHLLRRMHSHVGNTQTSTQLQHGKPEPYGA
jgi:hypothetical protein